MCVCVSRLRNVLVEKSCFLSNCSKFSDSRTRFFLKFPLIDNVISFLFLDSNSNKIVTCYFSSWSVYRPNGGSFLIENIDPTLCTHIVYAFAGLNTTDFTIRSLGKNFESMPVNLINFHKMVPFFFVKDKTLKM